MNFDANYGLSDFTDLCELPDNHAHQEIGDDMMRECEEIKTSASNQFLQPSGLGSGDSGGNEASGIFCGSGNQQQDLCGKG